MTHLSPRAIEELLAKAIYTDRNGKGCKPWSQRDARHKEPYLLDAKAVLTALEAEGMVVVPKSTFYEIANRASNMCDPDAAEWMPSIYKIACEAVGEDPARLLQAAQGGDDAGQ